MKHVMSVVVFLAIAVVPAMGAWSEDFQSYNLGSVLTGQGGWAGWDGGSASATVSDAHPKFAGDQAVMMGTNDDVVHEYSGYTSGQFVYSAMQYIPSVHEGAQTFFIMMNNYNYGYQDAPKGWAVQMKFDYATGLVTDDESSDKPGVAIAYDQWKEIKVVIDLDANTQTTYYGGQYVGTADWYDASSTSHAKSIAAVDLWADNGGAGVCYDNISLVPEPATLCLLALGALFLRRR